MECRNHSKGTSAATAPSPLQRSRSSTASSRLCQHTSNARQLIPAARSKSATKSRPSPDPTAARAKPTKENYCCDRDTLQSNNYDRVGARRPRAGAAVVPSAWALSPGRSLGESRPSGEKKRNIGGMMGFLTMRRKKQGASEKEEAAHQLRLVTSRLMQWRFINARAASAGNRLRSSVERKIFVAFLRINELRNIVAAKWIMIQRRRHKMKLARILNSQMHTLKKWEPLAKRNLEAVTALTRVLEAKCVPLPLVDGAQVDLVLLHDYIFMAVDTMIEIEAAIKIFYSKTEELSLLLGELAQIVGLEMDGLKQLAKTNTVITSLETHETSLRANLIQEVKKEVEVHNSSSQLSSMVWWQYHPWNVLGTSDPIIPSK